LTYNNFQAQMMYNRFQIRLFSVVWSVVISLLCLSPVKLTLWELTPDGLMPAVWQQGTPPETKPAAQPAHLEWKNGTVFLTSPRGNWQSPAGWTVQQAEWTDLNHDNLPEVTLLVQRPFEPWPVDRLLPYGGRIQKHQDARGQSSHIILITWKQDHWGELWAGSALARPVRDFMAADINQDGKQELIVREGTYQDSDPSVASSLAVWKWSGFGFELISRLDHPSTRFNFIISRNNRSFILLQ
jgi:hypothetical protein